MITLTLPSTPAIKIKPSEQALFAAFLKDDIAVGNIKHHISLYQLGLENGWAVYIGRYENPLAKEKVKAFPLPKWSNPYLMDKWQEERDGDRAQVLQKYYDYLMGKPQLIEEAKSKLRGKILFCHCKSATLTHYDSPNYRCHGDILREIVKGTDLNCYSKGLEALWEF